MNDLHWEIIKILATHKDLDTTTLHTMLQSYKKVSLANVYRALSQLKTRAIIQKDSKKVSLNTFWIINFQRLADKMNQTYIQNIPDVRELIDGQKFIITKSSFLEIDKIWIDMVGKIMIAQDHSFDVYFFNAHNYHILVTPETEYPFLTKLFGAASHYRFLIGHTTFLDRYAERLQNSWGVTSLATDNHPFNKDGYYLNIVGDYIMELIIPSNINKYLHVMMTQVTSLDEFDHEIMKQTLTIKDKYTLIVRKNAQLARSFKNQIEDVYANH